MKGSDRAKVLVVDDEPAIVDGHAARLEAEYRVRRAYGGGEALDALDESVDVVLLDRKMPDLSGEDVLETIRERELPCRVAMLTGVDPAFDILEMGFDDYLQKPVDEEELFQTIERLLRRSSYDEKLQEYFALASKAAILEVQYDEDRLADHEEYAELQSELERMRDELDRTLEDLPQEDRYATALRSSADGRTDI